MNLALPYFARMACVLFATGLFGYLTGCLASAALAPRVQRRLEAAGSALAEPGRTARWLLALRLMPLLVGLIVVAGLCLPSYVWLEPFGGTEFVSGWFAALALAGGLLAAWIGMRLARGALQSHRFAHRCLASARAVAIGETEAVVVTVQPSPWLALAGIVRPRLLVCRAVLDRLSPEQLQAALGHERAHQSAHDNLKRLLIASTPVLVAARRFRELERSWARLAEWCADDRSVNLGSDAGRDLRSLHLASALVEVARLGTCARPAAAVSLFTRGRESDELAARVERLLAKRPRITSGAERWRGWLIGAACCLLVGLMLQPATLIAVHEILEHLLR